MQVPILTFYELHWVYLLKCFDANTLNFQAKVKLVNPAAKCGSKLEFAHKFGNKVCNEVCSKIPPPTDFAQTGPQGRPLHSYLGNAKLVF